MQKFLTYMKETYLPTVTTHPNVKGHRFVRLLTDVGEGLIGYSLMCDIEDVKQMKEWNNTCLAPALDAFHREFGETILPFSTSMKVL